MTKQDEEKLVNILKAGAQGIDIVLDESIQEFKLNFDGEIPRIEMEHQIQQFIFDQIARKVTVTIRPYDIDLSFNEVNTYDVCIRPIDGPIKKTLNPLYERGNVNTSEMFEGILTMIEKQKKGETNV